MPFAVIDGQILFFAHVPKAAGTSIENYLEARFGALSMLDREWYGVGKGRNGILRRSVRTSPQHVTAADADMLLPKLPRVSFAVVRDPTARIISEYKYQRKYGHLKNRTIPPSFTLWFSAMITAARREPTICDNHIRPQVDFVPQDARVFRLEDGMEPLVAWLDGIAGETADDISIGRDLPSGGKEVSLCESDCDMIAEFYADDFDRYQYEPPRPGRNDTPIAESLRKLAGVAVGHGVVAMRRRQGWP